MYKCDTCPSQAFVESQSYESDSKVTEGYFRLHNEHDWTLSEYPTSLTKDERSSMDDRNVVCARCGGTVLVT